VTITPFDFADGNPNVPGSSETSAVLGAAERYVNTRDGVGAWQGFIPASRITFLSRLTFFAFILLQPFNALQVHLLLRVIISHGFAVLNRVPLRTGCFDASGGNHAPALRGGGDLAPPHCAHENSAQAHQDTRNTSIAPSFMDDAYPSTVKCRRHHELTDALNEFHACAPPGAVGAKMG
jgi:hypothetical protein